MKSARKKKTNADIKAAGQMRNWLTKPKPKRSPHPVTYEQFSKIVENLPDIAFEIQAKQIGEPYRTLDDCAIWYYNAFYTDPEVREKYEFKLRACPSGMREKVLQFNGDAAPVPSNDNENDSPNAEDGVEVTVTKCGRFRFPVSFATFERYIQKDRLLRSLAKKKYKDKAQYKAVLGDKSECQNLLRKYYNSFYIFPNKRLHKYKFQNAPPGLLPQLLKAGTPLDDEAARTLRKFTAEPSRADPPQEETKEIGERPIIESSIVSFVVFEKYVKNLYDIVWRLKLDDPDYIWKGFEDCALGFYLAFYLTPEIRSKFEYQLRPCTTTMQNRIFALPNESDVKMLKHLQNTNHLLPSSGELDIDVVGKSPPAVIPPAPIPISSDIDSSADKSTEHSTTTESTVMAAPERKESTAIATDSSVPFATFKRYIRNLDGIVQEMLKCEEYKHKSADDCALEYFKAFYATPQIRERFQFEIKPCPGKIRQKLLAIPKQEPQSTGNIENIPKDESIVVTINRIKYKYSVSFETFLRYINYDELRDQLISFYESTKNPNEGDILSGLDLFKRFYYSFYLDENLRSQFKYNFDAAPTHLKVKLMQMAIPVLQEEPQSTENAPIIPPVKSVMDHEDPQSLSLSVIQEAQSDTELEVIEDLGKGGRFMFPVPIKVFKQFINHDELIVPLLLRVGIENPENADYTVCHKIFTRYYHSFYVRPVTRTLFNYRFENVNPELMEKLLKYAVPLNDKARMEVEKASVILANNPTVPEKETPVSFVTFKRYIRNLDDIVQEMLKCEEYKHKSADDCALEYFKAFYATPQIRERFQYEIKPCPGKMREKLLAIPKQEPQSTGNIENIPEDESIVVTINGIKYKYSVSFETFLRYINYDELRGQLVSFYEQTKNPNESDSPCDVTLIKRFYYTFYLDNKFRSQFNYNFNAAPENLKVKLMQRAVPLTEKEESNTEIESIPIATPAQDQEDQALPVATTEDQALPVATTEEAHIGFKDSDIDVVEDLGKAGRYMFPVSLKVFKHCVNYDELLIPLLQRVGIENPTNADPTHCRKIFTRYYHSFYVRPVTRTLFNYRFENVNPELMEKLLKYAVPLNDKARIELDKANVVIASNKKVTDNEITRGEICKEKSPKKTCKKNPYERLHHEGIPQHKAFPDAMRSEVMGNVELRRETSAEKLPINIEGNRQEMHKREVPQEEVIEVDMARHEILEENMQLVDINQEELYSNDIHQGGIPQKNVEIEDIRQEMIQQAEQHLEKVIQGQIPQSEVIDINQYEFHQQEILQEDMEMQDIHQEKIQQGELHYEEVLQGHIPQNEINLYQIDHEENVQLEIHSENIMQEDMEMEDIHQENIQQGELHDEEVYQGEALQSEINTNPILYEEIPLEEPAEPLEIQSFPITFVKFKRYIKNLDEIVETMLLCEEYNNRSKHDCAFEYYRAFYTDPSIRKRFEYQLMPCPDKFQKKLLEVPDKTSNEVSEFERFEKAIVINVEELPPIQNLSLLLDSSTHNNGNPDDANIVEEQEPDNSYPVSFNVFSSLLYLDDIVKEMQQDPEYALMTPAACKLAYFDAFYRTPEIRNKYKCTIRPCPSILRKKILEIPDLQPESMPVIASQSLTEVHERRRLEVEKMEKTNIVDYIPHNLRDYIYEYVTQCPAKRTLLERCFLGNKNVTETNITDTFPVEVDNATENSVDEAIVAEIPESRVTVDLMKDVIESSIQSMEKAGPMEITESIVAAPKEVCKEVTKVTDHHATETTSAPHLNHALTPETTDELSAPSAQSAVRLESNTENGSSKEIEASKDTDTSSSAAPSISKENQDTQALSIENITLQKIEVPKRTENVPINSAENQDNQDKNLLSKTPTAKTHSMVAQCPQRTSDSTEIIEKTHSVLLFKPSKNIYLKNIEDPKKTDKSSTVPSNSKDNLDTQDKSLPSKKPTEKTIVVVAESEKRTADSARITVEKTSDLTAPAPGRTETSSALLSKPSGNISLTKTEAPKGKNTYSAAPPNSTENQDTQTKSLPSKNPTDKIKVVVAQAPGRSSPHLSKPTENISLIKPEALKRNATSSATPSISKENKDTQIKSLSIKKPTEKQIVIIAQPQNIISHSAEQKTPDLSSNQGTIDAEDASSNFFAKCSKEHKIPYLLYTSSGLKKTMWRILSHLTMEEFKMYTNVYNENAIYKDDKLLKMAYEHVVIKGNWPINFYIKLPLLNRLLHSKGVVLDKLDLDSFSPKIFHWQELTRFTNFETIVECDYRKRVGDSFSDVVQLFHEVEQFYTNCWTYDYWIFEVPRISIDNFFSPMATTEVTSSAEEAITLNGVPPCIVDQNDEAATLVPSEPVDQEVPTTQLPSNVTQEHEVPPTQLELSFVDMGSLPALSQHLQSESDPLIEVIHTAVKAPTDIAAANIKQEPITFLSDLRFSINSSQNEGFRCETIPIDEQIIQVDADSSSPDLACFNITTTNTSSREMLLLSDDENTGTSEERYQNLLAKVKRFKDISSPTEELPSALVSSPVTVMQEQAAAASNPLPLPIACLPTSATVKYVNGKRPAGGPKQVNNKKPRLMVENVPQLTHGFRPLPLIPMVRIHTDLSKISSRPIQQQQQRSTPSPSPSPKEPPITASQALAVDNTLMESSQLQHLLDAPFVNQRQVNEPAGVQLNSSNKTDRIAGRSPTPPTLHTPVPVLCQYISFRRLQRYIYFDSLSVANIAKYQINSLTVGATYHLALICANAKLCNVYGGALLENLFPHCSPSLMADLQYLLKDVGEFSFNCSVILHRQTTEDLRIRVLDTFMRSAPQFTHMRLQYENETREWATCSSSTERDEEFKLRKPRCDASLAIKPQILERMRELKRL